MMAIFPCISTFIFSKVSFSIFNLSSIVICNILFSACILSFSNSAFYFSSSCFISLSFSYQCCSHSWLFFIFFFILKFLINFPFWYHWCLFSFTCYLFVLIQQFFVFFIFIQCSSNFLRTLQKLFTSSMKGSSCVVFINTTLHSSVLMILLTEILSFVLFEVF